ncbi:MAG: aldehyde dehydrogenase family protein, partial [Pseudobdellovibrio sp.]
MKTQIISFNCLLKNLTGQILSSSYNHDVLTAVDDEKAMLLGLAKNLQNIKKGEKRVISLSAQEAYGFYDPQKIILYPRRKLPQNIGRGSTVSIVGKSGKIRTYRVIELHNDMVSLDENHPLAGQDLIFEIEALAVRPATRDEIVKDKRSVGVVDEDRERGIEYVAEPIGVVLALLPITNPTSTALFKAIVGAKTRNAMLFRPSARAARCALRAIEILQEAGERAGLPPDALQVIPDPTLDISQYLFHHDGVDFIWTTGGPKAVAATNAAGKPCMGVGSGNAPVYVHRSADLPMAVVDILVSKTFDSSVICPAEQTCVIDDAIYDEMIAE